ncbi:MAG: serine--tRNA ligase [Planctomycetota bacterium]
MIDLKTLREKPDIFRSGAEDKQISCDVDLVLELDGRRRALLAERDAAKAEQNQLAKSTGRRIGELTKSLKSLEGDARAAAEAEIESVKAAPAALKARVQELDATLGEIEPRLREALLAVPLPADPDVPRGASAADNVEINRWAPDDWSWDRTFEENRGFAPRTHVELCASLGLVDFPRATKLAGSRSYVLTGLGMRLHQAVLRYAFDRMTERNGFGGVSVPVLVREEAMEGTGFFPGGRDQAYHVEETSRGAGHDLFLTGTGEVGLMGLHQDEILDEADLPLQYVTVSTCFRREAGAAGRDTAGLYRIHQFDKVEQVVICRADEAESRAWHKKMIGYVEELLRELGLPYRLLQCCTADLGPKNADMIDIECWMPGRGGEDADGRPTGDFGETHSASRLYDFQCRRLNMRFRAGGEAGSGATTFCHSLNNTVAASPRILIPLIEMHQNADGTVTVPEPLRPYMGGVSVIEPV